MEKEIKIKSTFTKFLNFKGWKIRKVVKKNVYFLINVSIANAYGNFNTIEDCIEFVEIINKKNVKNKNCKSCNEVKQLRFGSYCEKKCYDKHFQRKRRLLLKTC